MDCGCTEYEEVQNRVSTEEEDKAYEEAEPFVFIILLALTQYQLYLSF